MPIIELQNVHKAYETKIAIQGLSFKIEPGTMFDLLGPNGSGKTSSIRMIIGIIVPDSGSMSLFDQPFNRKLLHRGRLFARRARPLQEDEGHGPARLPRPVARSRRHHGVETRTCLVRAHGDYRGHSQKTEELSKGMQQKIQFIAALLHEPDSSLWTSPSAGSIRSMRHCYRTSCSNCTRRVGTRAEMVSRQRIAA